MEKYNVYIVSNKGNAEAIIGENMSERSAEQRVMTGLMRIDKRNYFVGDFLVGSEQDIKFKKQLTKN